MKIRKGYKILFYGIIVLVLTITMLLTSITLLDDPISKRFRDYTEDHLNQYIAELTGKAANNKLSDFDYLVLDCASVSSISLAWIKYPEAAEILYHYLYGDGSDLEIESDYFKESGFIQQTIKIKGEGDHGLVALKQSDDWRLSLALNPFYIKITGNTVKIYHPKIEFAKHDGRLVPTIIPIGKLKIRMYDNLVSAHETKPFYVYSEWQTDPRLSTTEK